MILYNITINVSQDIEQDFISWMKTIHIPEVLETGIFHDHKFFRLIHDTDDGSTNYCIQYFTKSLKLMMEYESKYATGLRAKTKERYKDKTIAFRTLLETI